MNIKLDSHVNTIISSVLQLFNVSNCTYKKLVFKEM